MELEKEEHRTDSHPSVLSSLVVRSVWPQMATS